MAYIAVLAGTAQEANAHVERHHLPKGGYRLAAKAASVRNLRVSEIHILPGFLKRLDRHAILAELRYCKGERIAFHEPRGYVNLERAWDLAHAEQERRWNEGRLSYDEALAEAYVTIPAYFHDGSHLEEYATYEQRPYDKGGSLPPTVTETVNATGKPEPVLQGLF